MKILHYTFTSLRLACSLPLLIACINIFHYFYTSRANVRNNRALVTKN